MPEWGQKYFEDEVDMVRLLLLRPLIDEAVHIACPLIDFLMNLLCNQGDRWWAEDA